MIGGLQDVTKGSGCLIDDCVPRVAIYFAGAKNKYFLIRFQMHQSIAVRRNLDVGSLVALNNAELAYVFPT
jgi:hypothetical protein